MEWWEDIKFRARLKWHTGHYGLISWGAIIALVICFPIVIVVLLVLLLAITGGKG